jgi:hypothetical protein
VIFKGKFPPDSILTQGDQGAEPPVNGTLKKGFYIAKKVNRPNSFFVFQPVQIGFLHSLPIANDHHHPVCEEYDGSYMKDQT